VIEAMDEDEEVNFGTWEIARVTLFESRLTPRGPVYRTLGHSPLSGA
jgi:2'-5' RNA ligase